MLEDKWTVRLPATLIRTALARVLLLSGASSSPACSRKTVTIAVGLGGGKLASTSATVRAISVSPARSDAATRAERSAHEMVQAREPPALATAARSG